MRLTMKGLLLAMSVAAAVPVLTGAQSTPASARSEIRLQLADLLFGDERYWDAIFAYDQAKQDATPSQLIRASSGLLRSLLQVAEFNRAYIEAVTLYDLGPEDPDVKALYGDALWASAMFEEAEQAYRDVLAATPTNARARHGLAKSLMARSQLAEALSEAQTAINADAGDAEFHHTLSTVYRRLNRFDESAAALMAYVERLPQREGSAKLRWARTETEYLRSFTGRVPYEFEAGREDEVFTIPFRLINDKVVVRAKVNGRDAIDMVIDTGAEQMVLSEQTANDVGVHAITEALTAGVGDVGLRGLQAGRIDSLDMGPLKIANLPALIKNPPLTGLPTRRVPDSFSPIAVGLSTTIDYQNHHLVMARRLPEERADIELPLRLYRLALVRGVVNQELAQRFVVDTGGEVISISLSTASLLGMRPARHIPLRVFGTSGWDEEAYLLPGVDLAFDQIRYDNFAVVVLNLHRPSALLGFHIGGVVGHRFLSNYKVTLDLDRSVLRLQGI